jgi:hypothetical protein
MEKAGIIDLVGPENSFDEFGEALAASRTLEEQQPATAAAKAAT